MLGDSSVLATSVEVPATGPDEEVHEGGGEVGFESNSAEEDKSSTGAATRFDEGDGRMNNSAGGGAAAANRWPRQETLALLKIRSEMDQVFRDSSSKGPLWEEVSRKLAELGYHRSAKKCKEKFENVYKYHKRTKDGRTGKSDGKAYRFFDQLEAFENHHHSSQYSTASPFTSQTSKPPIPNPMTKTTAAANTTTLPWTNPPNVVSHVAVPNPTNTTSHQNIIVTQATNVPTINATPLSSSQPPAGMNFSQSHPHHHQSIFQSSNYQYLTTHLFPSSTSSSTASEEEFLEESRKRKRKWKNFFERLTKDVIRKQEELQKKFLETIERREHERMVREESWRIQEIERINREHEILIKERSTAVAKDAAVIAFLQKISGQQNPVQPQDNPPQPTAAPAPPPPPLLVSQPSKLLPLPRPPPVQPRGQPAPLVQPVTNLNIVPKKVRGENNAVVGSGGSSSRWPKAEVESLIRLRTGLDIKYQDSGPKGPLWEDISAEMQKLGYNRNAKRCKEKWENINKYFKKMKEGNKQRREDSKTCPYFDLLDALYKEKNKMEGPGGSVVSSSHPALTSTIQQQPLLVRPEQQWPLPQEKQPEAMIQQGQPGRGDNNNINMGQNLEEEEEEEDLLDVDEDEEVEEEEGDMSDQDEDDEEGGFEVVPNKSTTNSASTGNISGE